MRLKWLLCRHDGGVLLGASSTIDRESLLFALYPRKYHFLSRIDFNHYFFSPSNNDSDPSMDANAVYTDGLRQYLHNLISSSEGSWIVEKRANQKR